MFRIAARYDRMHQAASQAPQSPQRLAGVAGTVSERLYAIVWLPSDFASGIFCTQPTLSPVVNLRAMPKHRAESELADQTYDHGLNAAVVAIDRLVGRVGRLQTRSVLLLVEPL